jgi:hypothetical protein
VRAYFLPGLVARFAKNQKGAKFLLNRPDHALARTPRRTGKPTGSASVLNNRTSLDVAIGPWRDFVDLISMSTAGWGPRGDNGPGKGAVRELPDLPFLSFPIRARAELGLLLFRNQDRPKGRGVWHLVIWSDREHRITEKQPNQLS